MVGEANTLPTHETKVAMVVPAAAVAMEVAGGFDENLCASGMKHHGEEASEKFMFCILGMPQAFGSSSDVKYRDLLQGLYLEYKDEKRGFNLRLLRHGTQEGGHLKRLFAFFAASAAVGMPS
ncbi:hypothetical protein GH733_002672 [Mirounga leonina]|nr:hypothetical protein GH733_002672 [Mirounga leonina]